MRFFRAKDFPASLISLKRRGGPYQRAAETVEKLEGRITYYERGQSTDDPLIGLRLTKHGESRIRNCIKYDLTEFARLVTVQTDNLCVLLFAGTHDDTDRWLNRNAGIRFVVDGELRVQATFETDSHTSIADIDHRGARLEKLWTLLPEEKYEELVKDVPRSVTRRIEEFLSTTAESEIKQVLSVITNTERRTTITDVLVLLAQDKVEQAIARIDKAFGYVTDIFDLQQVDLPSIVNGDTLRGYSVDDPVFSTLLRNYARGTTYRDWMLFMHHDQERIVDLDFEGPAKLVGVSGSGKTCVVVRRAIRLASKYPGERVLIVTLNRALATLIEELIDACAPEELRANIDVYPFFILCQRILEEVNPERARHIEEHNDRQEHVDEIWQEYYRCERNNKDAEVFHEIHDSLIARGCSAERYIRDELDWIRSALPPAGEDAYVTIQRHGRRYSISQNFRKAILQGLNGWRQKMEVVGLIDTLGIAQLLTEEIGYISRKYRCVLVDEVQDFGNVELSIVHAVMKPGENCLFLSGDAAQVVTPKFQRLSELGLMIPVSRACELTRNYRNCRHILEAAYSVLRENLSEELIENQNLRILDPVASTFTNSSPLLLEGESVSHELRHAIRYAGEYIREHYGRKACIALCGYTLEEMRRFGHRNGLPVLDGRRNLEKDHLFLSDLANTKGFEFDLVIILNASQDVLPDPVLPEEESWRQIAMLYVAMTRAKLDLYISWSGKISPVFQKSNEHFLADTWNNYFGSNIDLPSIAPPEKMEQFRAEADRKPWRDLSGSEFLYAPEAIGISVELIAKIRSLVQGQGRIRQGQPVMWRTMGKAVDSCRTNAKSRQIWGPEVSQQLLTLGTKLDQTTNKA